VENAVAAAAVSDLSDANPTVIKQKLETYKGVKRRFEYIIHRNDFTYIDDYAHHPQEISACVESVRKMHPNKKICGIFQPHLFSRTRDFADDFARSLELLDKIVLLPIYPARELPIDGVTSKILLDRIGKTEKFLLDKENLIDSLKNIKPEILVTMGAGDIDRWVDKIKNAFSIEN
jgi:UDP-N-acetylmuramate--alanine ligase